MAAGVSSIAQLPLNIPLEFVLVLSQFEQSDEPFRVLPKLHQSPRKTQLTPPSPSEAQPSSSTGPT